MGRIEKLVGKCIESEDYESKDYDSEPWRRLKNDSWEKEASDRSNPPCDMRSREYGTILTRVRMWQDVSIPSDRIDFLRYAITYRSDKDTDPVQKKKKKPFYPRWEWFWSDNTSYIFEKYRKSKYEKEKYSYRYKLCDSGNKE